MVLTVHNVPASIAFYTHVLGMCEVSFGDDRKALAFGTSKLNRFEAGHEVVLGPVARTGAQGPLRSASLRDPDDNLIELSNPL